MSVCGYFRPSASGIETPRNEACAILRPKCTRMFKLAAQRDDERFGQHHDAVLATFALAHDEHLSIKVHVLYSKAQTLHQSKTCAVEQCHHNGEGWFYLLEQACDLRPR